VGVPNLNSRPKVVLVTDYAWPSLDREREIFARVDAQLLVAKSGSQEELVELAPEADAILCNWKAVRADVLRVAHRCLTVGRYGIGLDNIDVALATSLGIVVTNVPTYCVDDVADHTMALLLACNRKVCWFDRDIKSGRYDLKAQTPLHRLSGHTLGLVGFGRIGRAVARRAASFGLHVIALQSRNPSRSVTQDEVEFVSFSELLERSDYLSIHLPATAENINLFDASVFSRMKSGAVLINTARGSLIHSADLLQALKTGSVAAAGIDVWQNEPLPPGDPLASHPRIIATPHSAFYSDEALVELQDTAASQAVSILIGQQPQNIVNPTVLTHPNLRAHFFMTNEGLS
jgi:D-3-phosphoglycerate dehydrogenase / 2-oxoglutarate reductase